ncbi:GIY-YIG nuclease family protein [Pelagibacterium luteolum]|uniref:GIY-YIG nuclease family protein n=1 Tax=Pelagibacterium luteolum TaxID=440168 RepID=UPI001FCD566D|nr:GIY-YIG nuclease family protein [Pelagibacterium luteolum]
MGVTNDLIRRVWEHREGLAEGFTKTYSVKHLVHYETYDTVPDAIQREKNLKHWIRAWKIDLIETHNPDWDDLWWVIARG